MFLPTLIELIFLRFIVMANNNRCTQMVFVHHWLVHEGRFQLRSHRFSSQFVACEWCAKKKISVSDFYYIVKFFEYPITYCISIHTCMHEYCCCKKFYVLRYGKNHSARTGDGVNVYNLQTNKFRFTTVGNSYWNKIECRCFFSILRAYIAWMFFITEQSV